jgi:hypothetical protein
LAQADLISPRATRQLSASALAGLLGLAACCGAIYAACVTLSDWTYKPAEARWPLLTAVVDRAEVIVSASGGKDGDGTATMLRYRVRYQANGNERAVTLVSRSASSDKEAARLQSWAMQHGKGTRIEIRSDPAGEGHAVFASDEVSDTTRGIGSDLLLLIVSVLASVGLLALAGYLRRKEASAATAGRSSGRLATPA